MPSALQFKITGAKELEAALKDIGPKVATRLGDKAVRAGSRIIVKEAKRLCPKRTGALRRSIGAVRGRTNKQDERSMLVGFKKPGRRYAHLVEFGTVHSAAKPFLRPALDARAADALREMQEVLADGILRHEWKQALQFMSQTGDEIGFGEE
jgi:HK97 gp10 family phage protein